MYCDEKIGEMRKWICVMCTLGKGSPTFVRFVPPIVKVKDLFDGCIIVSKTWNIFANRILGVVQKDVTIHFVELIDRFFACWK